MNMDGMGDELNEILEEFFTEAEENLDNLEQDLIKLEAFADDGNFDKETVDRLFRVLHTLKGGAGFLGLEKIAKLGHAGENLLDEVRNGKVPVTKPVMDALLVTNDALKELLAKAKAKADDSAIDNSRLVVILEKLAAGEVAQENPVAAPLVDDGMVNKDLLREVMGDDTLDPSRDKEAALAPVVAVPASIEVDASLINKDLLREVMGDDTLDPSRDKDAEEAVSGAGVATPKVEVGAPVSRSAPVVEQRVAEDRRQGSDERRQAPRRNGEEGGETIRVETARLDKVMNLVGELVLARNSLLRQLNIPHVKSLLEKLDNQALIYGNIEQLSRVTQDLQMSVLSTRMQPIKKVFDKIPRQVRELKSKLGREVNLIIEGENTEVDKSLVEDLADPMVHMIRNALDHGIEPPDEREMSGKSREGTLLVRAFYEGNNVVIQVQEDGKGINPAKIRQIAVKKGIVSETVAQNMSDNDAIRLIIAPGFSTAEKVTDVSGRGVGMDVVNTKITNMQGTLDIRSELGKGTCFSIYLPLTLAIVNALVVGSNQEGFAIPIGDISEVIKFKRDGIHRVNESDVIELRGEPLPLYYLAKLTRDGRVTGGAAIPVMAKGLKPSEQLSLDDLEHAVGLSQADVSAPDAVVQSGADKGFVVVVRDGSSAMGLVVDELLGQEEVVVKQVTDMFDYNKAISGATITGDGKVHMILDVPFLLKQLSGAR